MVEGAWAPRQRVCKHTWKLTLTAFRARAPVFTFHAHTLTQRMSSVGCPTPLRVLRHALAHAYTCMFSLCLGKTLQKSVFVNYNTRAVFIHNKN